MKLKSVLIKDLVRRSGLYDIQQHVKKDRKRGPTNNGKPDWRIPNSSQRIQLFKTHKQDQPIKHKYKIQSVHKRRQSKGQNPMTMAKQQHQNSHSITFFTSLSYIRYNPRSPTINLSLSNIYFFILLATLEFYRYLMVSIYQLFLWGSLSF